MHSKRARRLFHGAAIASRALATLAIAGGVASGATLQALTEDYELAPEWLGENASFGSSIDASGPVLAVGALGILDPSGSAGAGYAFRASGGTLIREFVSPNGAQSETFGQAVALTGPYLVVTDYRDGARGLAAGAAFVFEVASGAFVHELVPPDAGAHLQFGISAAAHGDRVVIGNWNPIGASAVYEFEVSTGRFVRKHTAPGPLPAIGFGFGVDLDDQFLAAGAYKAYGSEMESGAVYLYDAPNGTYLRSLVPAAPPKSAFGDCVAVRDGTVLVGAKLDNEQGSSAGAAYLFEAETGTLLHKLFAPDPAESANFGSSVSLSEAIALVGAERDPTEGPAAGRAYVFDATTGELLEELTGASLGSLEKLGLETVLNGKDAFATSSGSDAAKPNAGAVFAFLEIPVPDCNANEVADSLDLASGTSADCNTNGTPDECDIASGASTDLDANGVPDECLAPPLGATAFEISLSAGGTQALSVEAGPLPALNLYLLLGSASGTTPGALLEGHTLSLVPDAYLLWTVTHANQPPLGGTLAVLPPTGAWTATITLPPGTDPSLTGATLHHAFVAWDLSITPGVATVALVSNAVPLLLTP